MSFVHYAVALSLLNFKVEWQCCLLLSVFGVAFPKILLVQPVVPLIEGVEGTVAHPMGCPTVPRGSFRLPRKKKCDFHCGSNLRILERHFFVAGATFDDIEVLFSWQDRIW